MNKAYRLIWSDITHTWAVVAEFVKAKGKRASSGTGAIANPVAYTLKTLALSLAMIGAAQAAPPVNELPTGGRVTAGSASISQSGSTMTINQNTGRAAVNWNTFNVGSGATVNIHQPGSSSVLLNRVLSGNPSQIFGQINANGQVFLTNPGGIYFAPGASVNVGGLVATTHSITDDDFMAGRDLFTRNGATGSVINDGSITADLNGYVALLAPEVRNHGVIVAQLGTVALAAGEAYELSFDNNRLANIRVTPATIAALVENGNAVQAPGGLILLSAQALNHLQGGVVNNSGSLEATGLTSNGGVVRLEASDKVTHTGSINVDAAANSTGNGGTATLIADLANHDSVTEVNGSISARGGDLGGNGGFVETSASNVNIGANARVGTAAKMGFAGTWLIDPTDFTISAGETAQSSSGIGNATLETALAAGNVSIATSASGSQDGDINVNAPVTWDNNTLTLTAHHDININAVMTAGAADDTGVGNTFAKLALNTGTDRYVNVGMTPDGLGFTGRVDFVAADEVTPRATANSLTINGTAYTLINSASSLQGIASGDLTGAYALAGNIDASSSITNFVPIGTYGGATAPFTGTFNGLGHSIDSLTISKASNTWDGTGLFGMTQNAHLANIGLTNAAITGGNYAGALVGFQLGLNGATSLRNSFATGSVSGGYYTGGLVGGFGAGWAGPQASSNTSATMDNAHFSGTVTSPYGAVGGLLGGVISYSDGLGAVATASISRSSASGTVSGGDKTGGLAGYGNAFYGTVSISESHADASASGTWYVGGLLGELRSRDGTASITNSYATGPVSGGTGPVGGLVGRMASWDSTTSVSCSYAAGAVAATHNYAGGLVGATSAGGNTGGVAIDNSYAVGKVSSAGGMVGGLVGQNLSQASNTFARIENSYALGNVEGSFLLGGLVGYGKNSTLDTVFATGNVTATGTMAGGLIGYGYGSSVISNAFATGTVTGSSSVGGLVGYFYGQSMQYVFATGNVTGSTNKGSLIGRMAAGNAGTLQSYFATGTVTGSQLVGNDPSYTGDVTPSSLGATTRTYLGGDPGLTGSWQGGLKPTLFDTVTLSAPISGNLIAWGITNNSGTIYLKDGSVGAAVNSLTIAKAGTGSDGVNLGTATLNYDPSGYLDVTSGKLNLPNAPTLTMGGNTYTVINQLGAAGSSTGTDLQGLTTNDATKKYVLGLDIDATATSGWNACPTCNANGPGFFGFSPVGTSGIPFKGTLDGLGHAVNHLTINRPTTDFTGLFGLVSGSNGVEAAIRNIGLADASVVGKYGAGALAGHIDGIDGNVAISNSYSTGSVRGKRYVGGLIGEAWANSGAIVSIGDSHSAALVSGFSYGQGGGLVGYMYGTGGSISISNSFATGNVAGSGNFAGGLVGYMYGTSSGTYGEFFNLTISNSYASGAVTAGNYVGGLVGYGQSYVFGSATGMMALGISGSHASGAVTGTGSIGGLVGKLRVYGSIGSSSVSNSYATGAVVSTGNSSSYGFGGLVGVNGAKYGGNASISNSYATGAVTGNYGSLRGGLVGYNYGYGVENSQHASAGISGSFASGRVSNGSYNGGLVGFNNAGNAASATIDSSYASGRVTLGGYAGGLVGVNFAVGYGSYAGSSASITNSHASGKVGAAGYYYLGGLVGENEALDDATNIASISNSYASGAVSGSNYVGGLVGMNYGGGRGVAHISDAYASGAVSGTYQVGGLVGWNAGRSLGTGSISDSHASGVVSGSYKVGGLVGWNYGRNGGAGSISEAYASGAVSGSDYVGGLVGRNYGRNTGTASISDAYATGAVSGTNLVGGLVGANYVRTVGVDFASISNTYSAASSVTGSSSAGGLVGNSNGTVSNSFYDKTLNAVGSMDNGFGTAKTSAELGDIATFVAAGWNIAQDNSLTASAAPKLGWQSTGATTVWVINSPAATVDLAYTLSALTGTHAYTGTAYLLGDLWSSSAIFGGGYASWVAGTDYTFQYGGNTVSGFTNAATYSSIGISILRTGYQVAGSGNTAGTLTIDKAHLTVTADDKSRLYGEANPTFTQTISGFVNGETLATSGVTGTATGSSTADGSTAPGRAVIVASASGLTSTNYDFTDLRDGWLTIAAVNGNEPVTGTAEVEPPPPPPAPPSAPLPTTESSPPPLGDAGNTPPPAPEQGESGGGEGFGAANGVIAVELVREPSVQESGVISVSIPKEMATAGSGFTFKLPEQLVENAGDQPISARLANGDPLPAWLTFDEQSRAFVATAVPDSAFPVQVVVSIGGTNVTIIISERPD